MTKKGCSNCKHALPRNANSYMRYGNRGLTFECLKTDDPAFQFRRHIDSCDKFEEGRCK